MQYSASLIRDLSAGKEFEVIVETDLYDFDNILCRYYRKRLILFKNCNISTAIKEYINNSMNAAVECYTWSVHSAINIRHLPLPEWPFVSNAIAVLKPNKYNSE